MEQPVKSATDLTGNNRFGLPGNTGNDENSKYVTIYYFNFFFF